MKRVGAHVSIAGGLYNSAINARKIGARAFGMFTKNQKQWYAKPISEEDSVSFEKECSKSGFNLDFILPHDSYLINLGHPEQEKWEKSRDAFYNEFKRCEILNLNKLNFHPGSHLGRISEEECLQKISAAINYVLANTSSVTAVIENTAGQGNNVGFKFEHLATIISGVEDKNRIGICIDTCHAFAAGYDLRTESAYQKTMSDFDKIVGFQYLKGMHLNDSKKVLGSRVDRHASLGKGEIGLDCFKYIMMDKRIDDIPLILETPDNDLWEEEIKMLYDFCR